MRDETQLIDAARRGDTSAFGELVSRYQDRLFNAITHVTGNADVAEDVVQETMVRAYFRLDSFKGGSRFYTWIYRIAFNLAMNEKRSQRPHLSVDSQDDGNEPRDPGESPDGRIQREEAVRTVEVALAQLPDEFRAVIVLRELEGCAYDAIAEILGISVGTVRSRLHRAREQLRETLRRLQS